MSIPSSNWPGRTLQSYDPSQEPLNILHHDDDCLVLSKPSGLLSVPGRDPHLQDSLQSRVEREFPNALLVHRLDMETSGVFLMAMNKDAQRNFGLQFERRKTEKVYIARVKGILQEKQGLIDLPLRCDWERRPVQMVCHEHGRPSQTRYKVITEEGDISRIKLMPITGRSHQLRVHMAEIGHPILGDPFYADEDTFQMADRLQLHAESLTVHHPKDGQLIKFYNQTPF